MNEIKDKPGYLNEFDLLYIDFQIGKIWVAAIHSEINCLIQRLFRAFLANLCGQDGSSDYKRIHSNIYFHEPKIFFLPHFKVLTFFNLFNLCSFSKWAGV
jgi:hypothetical protein